MKAGLNVLYHVKKRKIIEKRSSQLYEYSKYVYDQSVNRFSRVDQKAAWMLSTLAVVIGVVFTLGSKWIIFNLSSTCETIFSFLSCLFALGVIVSAGFSVGFCIATLRISEVQTPPLSESVVDYILSKPLLDSQTGAATTLLEAHDFITSQLEKKGKNLERTVVCTVIFLAFTVIAFLISTIHDLSFPLRCYLLR